MSFGIPLIWSDDSRLYSVLNEKVTSRQTNVYKWLWKLGETAAYSILLAIGLGFTLTSPLWIRNVYKRFMKRRYENMEGFRDSRQ